eukprot:4623930-Amphidinium_carterae.2
MRPDQGATLEHLPEAARLPGNHRRIRCSHGIHVDVPRSSTLKEDEARIVARLHVSMGHPDSRAMLRLLAQQKVKPQMHEAVKGLSC